MDRSHNWHIPQGSVLGPVLFLIYINDILEGIKSTIRLFADDTKIFGPVENREKSEILQNDVSYVSSWSSGYCRLMLINV